MAPKKKQASPANSMSQVPPPITTTPEEWVPAIHGSAMRPPIYAPSHTGPSTMTLSAPDERSISTSSTATLPAPGERPANTSQGLDNTQIPQYTSARDKSERKCNIRIHEQALRSKQHFMQERQKDFVKLQEEFNKLQEEFNRSKREMDRVKGDIEKAEGDKGMLETLLTSENKLKQKEDQCDSLITMVYNLKAEITRPSLALPLQGTKRPHPDEMQDRSTRRRPETAKD